MTLPKTVILAGFLLTITATAIAQAPAPSRPAEPNGSVTLSLIEYNRLIDLASQPRDAATPAPVDAVVSMADMHVRVNHETARGLFNVTGEVLRAGVTPVVLLAGATLVDATAGGTSLPLMAAGGVHSALIPGPGPFALVLEWAAPLSFSPGRASFILPVPPAGAARATLDLPGEQADVRLSAGLVTRRTAANGRTMVDVTLDSGSATEVSWSMRDSAPAAASRELRTLADVMTLVTLGESEVRMAALVDLTVVQGELRTLALRVPAGYEVTAVSGASLSTSETRNGEIVLTVAEPRAQSHQFLIALERAHASGPFMLETGFVSVPVAQRERGEIAVEGVGTLELTAAERDGAQRIDVRELSATLHAFARLPILAAFRYQRTPATRPTLALAVKKFDDAGVLAAVADHAVATTLITSDGRMLTEVSLQVKNRAQPFLKVTLPPGASIVSVDVAGAAAKPVLGADGTRVPLLRAGLRADGPYRVSFVYLHAATPLGRSGEVSMTLPRMDMPVALMDWEVFVPERYSVRIAGGNVVSSSEAHHQYRVLASTGGVRVTLDADALPGQIRGVVTDMAGGALPGVSVSLVTARGLRTALTAEDGAFLASGIPPGEVTMRAELAGFRSQSTSFTYDERPRRVDFVLDVAGLSETVSVVGETPRIESKDRGRLDRLLVAPSQNVINLQRRTAGVLPVRVDVPRAGTSHRFVKPLVVDQETVVKLRYKRK
jgi:hypothetical protein